MYATPADGYMIPQLVTLRMVSRLEHRLRICPMIGHALCAVQARRSSRRYNENVSNKVISALSSFWLLRSAKCASTLYPR